MRAARAWCCDLLDGVVGCCAGAVGVVLSDAMMKMSLGAVIVMVVGVVMVMNLAVVDRTHRTGQTGHTRCHSDHSKVGPAERAPQRFAPVLLLHLIAMVLLLVLTAVICVI